MKNVFNKLFGIFESRKTHKLRDLKEELFLDFGKKQFEKLLQKSLRIPVAFL